MYTHILYLNACAGLQPPRDRKRANQAVRVRRGHGARGVRGRSSVRLGTPCAESNKRRQQRRGTFPLLHTPRTCCVLRRMLPTRKCPSQHARGTPGSGRSLARPLFTESPGQGLQSAGISFGEGSLAGIAFGEAQSAGIAFGEGDSAGISFREARQTENQQILPRQTKFRAHGPRQTRLRQEHPSPNGKPTEPPSPNAKASEAWWPAREKFATRAPRLRTYGIYLDAFICGMMRSLLFPIRI